MNSDRLAEMLKNQINLYLLSFVLIISFFFKFPSIWNRSIWYDDAITLLETAGNAKPSWPTIPEQARIAKNQFIGKPSLSKIAVDLKRTDIHPPIYYWILSLWRRLFGFSIETARMFSLFCSTVSVIILYFILKTAKFKRPFIPTIIYALSFGAVHFGGEARAYALGELLILLGALFACLAIATTNKSEKKSKYFSIAMAVSLGFALLTNYLTLFPIVAIFIWFLCVRIFENRSLDSIIYPIITVLIFIPWLPTFINHVSARPHQNVGYKGEYYEIIKIVKMNIINIITVVPNNFYLFFKSITSYPLYSRIVCALILFLLLNTIFFIFKNYQDVDKRSLSLFVGLAFAPSLGLFGMDFLFNKNLSASRYIMFGGFSIVVLLSYGISQLKSKIPLTVALMIFLPLQIFGNNWISERSHYQSGSNYRSFAKKIKNSSKKSKIVAIGGGYGRGIPGAIIYELSEYDIIVVINKKTNIKQLCNDFRSYDEVWIAFSDLDKPEIKLLKCLMETNSWKVVDQDKSYARLNRII